MEKEYGRAGRLGNNFSMFSGGSSVVPKITKIYDQNDVLQLEAYNNVIYGRDALGMKFYADNSLEMYSIHDINFRCEEDIYVECREIVLSDFVSISGTASDYFSVGAEEEVSLFSNNNDLTVSAGNILNLDSITGVFITGLKSGATQALAGAANHELWITSGHDTLPDNVLMVGT